MSAIIKKSASRAPSKSSSSNSSPSGTLRGASSLLHIEPIYDNIELLLQEDTTNLDLLCNKASDFEEFPSLLFRLFDVHAKTDQLLRWALEKETKTLSPNELFRGDTIATRLFYYQFFGDHGKSFLNSVVATLVEEIAGVEHSLEIEFGRNLPASTPVEVPQNNLKWILQKLSEFIAVLSNSVYLCPLRLRQSFLFLKDVVGSRVENGNLFVASVLFLRLICPCLVSPEEYGMLENASRVTEHGRRGLVIATKILQSTANNAFWDNKTGADLVNLFIKQHHPVIIDFATRLTDPEAIEQAKEIAKGSMLEPISEAEIRQSHEHMQEFIGRQLLMKTTKSEIDYDQKYQSAMNLFNSIEWKYVAGKKKQDCEYHVSQMKQEGSNLLAYRYSGTFKANFELVKEYIRDVNPEMTIDDRISINSVIEQYSNEHFDGYMVSKAQFPVQSREFVYTCKNFDENPNRWVRLTYSIDREDKPTNKKIIRGVMNLLLSVIERDSNNPEYTNFTYIFHVDLKGWIPAFFLNHTAKGNLVILSKIAKRIMQLGKPPAIKQKKSKKEGKLRKEKS